ncbi:ABC transporter substrate-binding protein [Faecalibaculum rodentium]|uniref:ABC transporter substrate-binding protein n=1 Tax=Faecalibaculum rodentium TaxID=1702221 RepID=UPI0025826942|nr:extracellular solute-binding protein [Faecalibaculum rodentium]
MKCAKLMTALVSASCLLAGCASGPADDKIQIEIVSYKPEAAKVFEEIQDLFNETHDDFHLTINSPNEAMTILKTRFVREDYPDIVAIGGDINYSGFLDAGLFENLEGQPFLDKVKEGYRTIDKQLEFVPLEGDYAVPYVANAAGILYNRELFEEHGWKVPETWEEFTALCETIAKAGVQPLYAGYKDTWTTLAPWNAMAVELADPDICQQVNRGEATFSEAYDLTAERIRGLLDYIQPNPSAYGYSDAATAFANEEAAMWAIGSYAIPQIRSVNPDMEIGSFVMPATDKAEDRWLNSGIDLQFCVMEDSPNKEATMEVIDYLCQDEVMDLYLADQGGISCLKGDFAVPEELGDMKEYIESGKVRDFHDHYYPSEMAADAMIQTYLLDTSADAKEKFLKKFDTEWQRYNRDLIRRLQEENQ